MAKVEINNQSVSYEEAMKKLCGKGRITQASIEVVNEKKDFNTPATHEGIDGFDREFFAGLSEEMSKCNAQSAKLTFSRIPKLLNRDLYITLANPGVEVYTVTIEPKESSIKKVIVRILMKLLK
jgi:hypothetical protein